MVFSHAPCHFYLILIIIACTDAVNISAMHGSTVCLPCTSDLYAAATATVTWRKTGSPDRLCLYQVQNATYTHHLPNNCRHHINVNERPPVLCITRVKTKDAGYYNCSVFKTIPPPTVVKINQVNLHIEGPPFVTIEPQMSNKSDCIWLLCELDGLDSTLVNFTWSRNGQSVPETTSSLHLYKPDWSEGDIFTCNISQSSNYSGLSASITIAQAHSRIVPDDAKKKPVIIICVGVLGGTLALICLIICIYKHKKGDSGGSTVYINKVYENFSFSTAHQQTQRDATEQQEQCIYEN